jgi:hypothetical protein
MDKASTTKRRKDYKANKGWVCLEPRPTAAQKCAFLNLIFLNQTQLKRKSVVSLLNLSELRPMATQKRVFFLNLSEPRPTAAKSVVSTHNLFEPRPKAAQKRRFLYLIFLNKDQRQHKRVVSLLNHFEPRPKAALKRGFIYLIFTYSANGGDFRRNRGPLCRGMLYRTQHCCDFASDRQTL